MTTRNDTEFSFCRSVHCYEQDLKGKLRPGEIFNWFQETACRHCRLKGIALEDLQPRGYTWVIHRHKIAVAKMPLYGQECRVSTWACARRDIISVRRFAIDSKEGERLISGVSHWALLNLKTQRPVKLTAVLPPMPACGQSEPQEELKPLNIPAGLPAFSTTRHAASAWSLDKNRHVNNSVYIFWACDNLYPEVPEKLRLNELQIDYKRQAFHGQKIRCDSFRQPGNVFLLNFILEESGESLAHIKSAWENDA